MNFGPEWMRGTTASISKGSEQTQNAGSVASVLPQQQASLASNAPRREYGDVDSGGDQLNPFRYSRDFILGLFKQTDIPIDFKEHDIVTRKEAKPPMGLKPMTEEESKAFKGPVNSNLSRRPPQHHHSHHQGRHHHISNNNNNNNNNSSSSSINNNNHYQSTTLGTRTRPRGTYPHGGMSKDGLAGSTDDMAREIGLRDSFSKYTDPTASISLEDEGPNLWAGVNIRRNMVGSFSADGVFRLDGADASLGEVLEPSPQVQKDVVDAFVVEKALPTPTSPVAAMVGREPGGIGSALGPTSLAPENPLGRYPQGDLLGAASSADAVDHGISGAHRNIQLTSDQSESLAALIELTQWWYRDTFGNVQGPFSTNNMQEWFKNGFFPPDLEVKSSRSPNFEPLNMLILRVNNGIEPFAAAVAMSLAAPSMSQKSGPSPKPTGNGAPNPRVDTVAASASEASIGGQGTTLGGPTPSPDEVGVEPIPSLSQLMQYAFSGESVLQPASGSGGQAQPVNPSVQILQILEMHALKLSKYVSLQHHVSALRTEANQKLVQIMFAYEDQLRQFDLQGALTQEVRAHLQQRFEILESQTRQHYEVEIQTATNTLSTLENSFDPLIRDALRQGGSEYALNLVQGQIQATRNSLILGQAPDPQQYQERQQQGDTAGASPDSPNEPTAQDLTDQLKSLSVVSEGPTAAPEEQVVDKSPEIFEEDSLQGVADKQPNIDSKDSLPKENKEDKQQQQQQQAAVQKSGPVKPKKKATNSAASATISPEKTGLSTPTSRQETKAEPAKPSVAPWNNVAAKPAPKKSLAEIQKEEENARRLQQQKQGANTDSKFSAKSFRKQTPTRYADLLASDDSHTSSLVFNSPELNAPASVTANAWKTPGVAGSVVRLSPKQPTTQAPQNYSSTAARANINGASQQKDAKRDSASSGNHEPSLQFLAWCRAKLRGLRGINVDEFIQVLLTFPLNPPKSSLEIIAEQVYAYSKDLNGRQFAEEFVKKRKEDAKGTFKAPSSLVSNGNAKSPRTSSNEFQVVGKKGRPAHT